MHELSRSAPPLRIPLNIKNSVPQNAVIKKRRLSSTQKDELSINLNFSKNKPSSRRKISRTSWSASKAALGMDQDIIDNLFDAKMKEIKSNNLEAVKISRHSVNLKNSYIFLKDGTIIRYFHKSGKKCEAVVDKNEGVVGEGGIKLVKKMYNKEGQISYVVGIIKNKFREDKIKDVIAVNKEIAKEFSQSPNLLPAQYIEWTNRHGEIKRGFLTPKMDTFETTNSTSFRETIPALPDDFTLMQAVDLFVNMAEGVKTLHDKDWVHLDIKPANILLKNLQVYLTDFDFALKINDTVSIPCIGSPAYMAPELLSNKTLLAKKWGKCADMYSLGITFKELLDKIQTHVEVNWGLDTEDYSLIHKVELIATSMSCLESEDRLTVDQVIAKLKEIKNV